MTLTHGPGSEIPIIIGVMLSVVDECVVVVIDDALCPFECK